MKRLISLLLLLLFLASTAPANAQAPVPHFPVTGTVTDLSPVFIPRDDDRDLVVMLPAGTSVQVLGRQGVWFRVVFPGAEGAQRGLMEPHDIRVDPDAPALSIGSSGRTLSERGFAEVRGFAFPQVSASDPGRALRDTLLRQEVFWKPGRWAQLAAGIDLRGSSYGQVEDEWRLDVADRGVLRPRASVRRLALGLTSSHLSLDLGKQFIRWGRTDVLSPVDRFAPRDYLNILDSEFLPVTGMRAAVRAAGETFEVVWVPELTPSRLPIVGRRWAALPPEVGGVTLEDHGTEFPSAPSQGFRWSHAGRFEMGLSYFDGFNHLPEIITAFEPDRGTVALTRFHEALRSYGGEVSIPMAAFTLKGEAAYFTSPTATHDEYVLYVIEGERQAGEWLLDAGYTAEVVTELRGRTAFPAERGVVDSIIGRASYTIDPRRTLTIEGAAHRNGHGVYARGEFSQVLGRHLRLTLAVAGIGGRDDDFLGQYQRNSHASALLRFNY